MRLVVRTDRTHIRSTHHSRRYVLAEIEAPAAPAAPGGSRPPVNLSFVLDRSGSMGGSKIDLARRAVAEAIEHLRASDRFSVVVYDNVIDTVVESTSGSREAKRNALERLKTVDARGTTDLAQGWLRGCEQVAAHLARDGVNRALLLTDGLANVGVTDPGLIARHAAELRARGVSTSTFGVGTDFDEALLQSMAVAGGGNFYYIERPEQIPDTIASEVGEALDVVAHDVVLRLTVAPGIRVDGVSPHPVATHGDRVTVSLGDLVSEQVLDVVLRLTFPYGDPGQETAVMATLEDRDGLFAAGGRAPAAIGRLTWSHADDRTNDGQARERAVDRAVAGQYAGRARQEAVHLNRSGAYEEARQVLRRTAARIRGYAGNDPGLRALAEELEAEAADYGQFMAEAERKSRHALSSMLMSSRDMYGKSRKRR